MSSDVRREIERVLTGEPLRQFGVAPFQGLDDPQMIDDRARRSVVLSDGRAANGAHVNQKIARRIDDGLRAAERDDRGMKGDVRVGVFAQMLGGRRVLELVEQMPQLGDFRIGACSVARRAAIDSSAAHIWIISMISRLDLRMM